MAYLLTNNSYLTQSTWYIDPVLGSDGYTGSNPTFVSSNNGPVKTWAEIVRRYGTYQPILPQTTTYYLVNSQPSGVDPIFFEPRLYNGNQAILNGLTYVSFAGAAFGAGTLGGGFGYSGATKTAGGTAMTMASVPAYIVKGILLYNQNRQSYAFVDSVTGGTATLTQPQTAASLTQTAAAPGPVIDNDWVAGDIIDGYLLPSVNLKRWNPVGGDESAASQPCSGWAIGLKIADFSGIGASIYMFENHGTLNVMSLCLFPSRVHACASGGRGNGLYLNGCMVVTAITSFSEQFRLYGGSSASTSCQAGEVLIDNNTICHGTLGALASALILANTNGVFCDGTVSVTGCGVAQVGAPLWGTYSVTLNSGGVFYNATGTTFTASALLTTGALKLGTSTTGTSYNAGVLTDGVSITPANLDTNNGLQNPRTGAKFTNGT